MVKSPSLLNEWSYRLDPRERGLDALVSRLGQSRPALWHKHYRVPQYLQPKPHLIFRSLAVEGCVGGGTTTQCQARRRDAALVQVAGWTSVRPRRSLSHAVQRGSDHSLLPLAEAGPVRLVVYNLMGQQVRVLADGWVDAGAHSMRWDGRTAAGAEARFRGLLGCAASRRCRPNG